MRQQRFGHGGVAGRKALNRDAAQTVVDVSDNIGRRVECQMEDCGGQRAHQYADLLLPTVAVLTYYAQARAEQPKISERVLEEGIAALELLRPLLLLVGEARDPVTGRGELRVVSVRLAQSINCSVQRGNFPHQGVIVAQHT